MLTYSQKHAFSAGLAVALAWIVNHYFSFSHQGVMVITALLMSQTTQGTPIRQGGLFLLALLAALVLALVLVATITTPLYQQLLLTIPFLISGFWASSNPFPFNKARLPIVIFSLLLWLFVLLPTTTFANKQALLLDLALGAVIGLCGSHFIFPRRLGDEFKKGIIPVLQALANYSDLLTQTFLQPAASHDLLRQKKMALQETMQSASSYYPEWVYEAGFNPGLRAGFRFFLIQIERLTELYLSMSYLIHCRVDAALIHDLSPLILQSMQENNVLIHAIIDYLENKKIPDSASSLTKDMVALEDALQAIIPGSLELLDLSPDYLVLTAFVRDIKAAREILLQLGLALTS